MQVSKHNSVARSYLLAIKMLFVVGSCAFILMWMNHTSINLYWQQKYHAPSPIEGWDRYAYWEQGSKFTSALTAAKTTFVEQLTITSATASTIPTEDIQPEEAIEDNPPPRVAENIQPLPYHHSVVVEPPLPEQQPPENIPMNHPVDSLAAPHVLPATHNSENITSALITTISAGHTPLTEHAIPSDNAVPTENIPIHPGIIEPDTQTQVPTEVAPLTDDNAKEASTEIAPTMTLQAGDEVFFVGDSLMQGIAPHMINALRKDHQIHSINLSKQSTGLAYPSFFNWPKTVKATLEKNQNIRLMVIFLGPNDPWNMPDKRGKPYLHFKSAEWESAYRSRVDAILEMAQQHDVQVIWVEAPNMRKKSLSSAMRYLSQIYQQETEKFHQLYVTTNDILGCEGDEYTNVIKLENNKRVKVRTDDGIHFSLIGQRRIANKILSLIQIKAQEDDDQNT